MLLFKTYHGLETVEAVLTSIGCHRRTVRRCASCLLCYKHMWMLNVINWWWSSVKLSW